MLAMVLGAAGSMKGLWFVEQGNWWGPVPGFIALVFVLIGWWGDVLKESRAGDHTEVVQISLRYGMVLFIASEVMFFVAWFWEFFEMAIFHTLRANPAHSDIANPALAPLLTWNEWPVGQVDGHAVKPFDPFHLPLINTLILLLSGTTVTWAHHAMTQGDRKGARNGLILTVLLGMIFTWVQFGVEYPEAGFAFGNEGDVTTANVYGASFFMATGFHGAHVIIGTIFLAICLLRVIVGQMTPQKHFGLEAAAWYWHFVDVVWLFLFTFVYVMPYLTMQE
jgi:cytochrome c oxidase subunit 3